MEIVGIDTETFKFGQGEMAPKVVCLSWALGGDAGVVRRQDAFERLRAILGAAIEGQATIVGAFVAYDARCCMRTFPELAPLWWQAYAAGHVEDVLIREKLVDIATDRHGFHKESRGYSLAAIVKARLNIDLEKSTWRTSFDALDDLPIDQWPAGARDYSTTDASILLPLWHDQEERATKIGYALVDGHRQARADLALQLASAWGIRTDPVRVQALSHSINTRLAELAGVLRRENLMRPNGATNTKAIRERVLKHYPGDPPRTDKGAVQTGAEVLEECDDAVLNTLAEYKGLEKAGSTFVQKLFEGTIGPIHCGFDVLGADTGRISSFSPNLTNQPRAGGVRECFVPREGCALIACDFDAQEMRTWAQACVDLVGWSTLAESFRKDPDFDPHSHFAANRLGVTYTEGLRRKAADDEIFKTARQRAKACFHPDTEILTSRRGWVRIADLVLGDEVAAAYPQTAGHSVIVWERPLALTRRKAPGQRLIHLKNEGIDLRVTSDHRMLGFNGQGAPYVTTPERLSLVRMWGNAGTLANGQHPDGVTDLTTLRLAVATQADGSYQHRQIRFGFTKAHKIARMRRLLAPFFGDWAEGRQGRVTTFVLRAPLSARVRQWLNSDKTIPWAWVTLPCNLRETILDELPHWDASAVSRHRFAYCSTGRQNADVVQAVASVTGRKARLTCAPSAGRRKACYRVSVGDHSYSRGGALTTRRVRYTGTVVCLSVPASFVLVRDRGVPVVIGQCNFGFPGGMGARKFRTYARGYGVNLTDAEATSVKGEFLQQYPEAPPFFAWVSAMVPDGGKVTAQLKRSGRWRGGCRYTQLANIQFQGPASDASKTALFEVSRRCHVDPQSGLYGSRPLVFVHDELIIETPLDRVHEAAHELEDVMARSQEVWTPDVPARASATAMLRWSKKAKRLKNAAGRLIPWDDGGVKK
jgi:hypothetical protein